MCPSLHHPRSQEHAVHRGRGTITACRVFSSPSAHLLMYSTSRYLRYSPIHTNTSLKTLLSSCHQFTLHVSPCTLCTFRTSVLFHSSLFPPASFPPSPQSTSHPPPIPSPLFLFPSQAPKPISRTNPNSYYLPYFSNNSSTLPFLTLLILTSIPSIPIPPKYHKYLPIRISNPSTIHPATD